MDKKFVSGLFWKRPTDTTREKAPWVKGHLSVKVDDFINFINANRSGEWMNIDLKESKDKTKLYFEVNEYKKTETVNTSSQVVSIATGAISGTTGLSESEMAKIKSLREAEEARIKANGELNAIAEDELNNW